MLVRLWYRDVCLGNYERISSPSSNVCSWELADGDGGLSSAVVSCLCGDTCTRDGVVTLAAIVDTGGQMPNNKQTDRTAKRNQRKRETKAEAARIYAEKMDKKERKKAEKKHKKDEEARAALEGPLNKQLEFATKANACVNPLALTDGMLFVGEGGVEFRDLDGPGFMKMPWVNISLVRADVYGKKHPYVRSIDIVTDQDQTLTFVVAKGMDLLKAMRKHLPGDKMIHAANNFKKLAKVPFWKRGLKERGSSQKKVPLN